MFELPSAANWTHQARSKNEKRHRHSYSGDDANKDADDATDGEFEESDPVAFGGVFCCVDLETFDRPRFRTAVPF